VHCRRMSENAALILLFALLYAPAAHPNLPYALSRIPTLPSTRRAPRPLRITHSPRARILCSPGTAHRADITHSPLCGGAHKMKLK